MNAIIAVILLCQAQVVNVGNVLRVEEFNKCYSYMISCLDNKEDNLEKCFNIENLVKQTKNKKENK